MLSSLKLTSCTPLGKQQVKKIKTIWQSLQDNNDSHEFRHPVDWQSMGLSDYPQLIKHPMDLSTINKKLRQQRYQSVEEVLDDIQLIWDNCKLYNQQGCWIYDLADKLEKSFKKMVKTFLPIIVLPGTQNKPAATSVTKMQEQQVKYQQKIRFTDRIKVLRPQQLGMMISKIKQTCPKAYKQLEGEKSQILVDLMDANSFKSVTTYLQTLEEPQDLLQKKIKA